MTAYADLEMGLHRRDIGSYTIELRFNQPDSDADIRLVRGDPALVQFDMERLGAFTLDDAAYGQLLSQSLFSDPAVRTAFAQARSTAQTLDAFLRLRLFIGPSAPELHNLRWETLRDPQDGTTFLTSERLLFSRYLSSLDWRPVRLRRGRCTPILGPGLAESLLGSRREIAQRWAETYHFPMAPHDREDLPQVAQYLAVNQDAKFPRGELIEYLRREMLSRYGDGLSEVVRGGALDELVREVGSQRRERAPAEPHRTLAELPLSIYITTDVTNLLADALKAAGKEPRVELCRWNEDIAQLPSIYDQEPNYRPDDKRPLVYHLFDRLQEPDSLILTEDDYFDYLVAGYHFLEARQAEDQAEARRVEAERLLNLSIAWALAAKAPRQHKLAQDERGALLARQAYLLIQRDQGDALAHVADAFRAVLSAPYFSHILRGHEGGVRSVAFSPDGTRLASGSADKSICIWATTETLPDRVCAKVWRNLTLDEWHWFVGEGIPYERTCPNLPLHPSFIRAGQHLARAGDVDGAIAIFQRARELEPGLALDPKAEAKKWVAQGQVEKGEELAGQGKVKEAVAAHNRSTNARSNAENFCAILGYTLSGR
jgi:WD domain, G-beta repeat